MSTSDLEANHASDTKESPQDKQLRRDAQNAILDDFLAPNSTLSLDEAIDRAVPFYQDDPYGPTLNSVVLELGNKLSYDDPAQLKLVQFYIAFVESGKWMARSSRRDKPEAARKLLCDRFCIGLYDSLVNISEDDDMPPTEDTDIIEYVNGHAFRAKFTSLPTFTFPYSRLRDAMEEAFEYDISNERPSVRDGIIMGAAQWPKWAAPELLRLVQKPGDPELDRHHDTLDEIETDLGAIDEDESANSAWIPFLARRNARKEAERLQKQRGRTHRKIKDRWPYTWEDWQKWKAGFRAAAEDETHSETCRKLAEEAADLMALQEKKITEKGIEANGIGEKDNQKANTEKH